jgi:hypothetical protein
MTTIIAVNDSSSAEIFPELTRDVIDRMMDAEGPRLREILALVVSHVHAIVREAKITHDEWWQAIDFLTRAGKMCSESRQEFILLSDILGISMLVDAIDHVGGPGLSESTVLGPFYAGQQRELAAGESILLRKRRVTHWRCVAALRTPRDGRSQTRSWKSGRPHPINCTMFRTKISRTGICGVVFAPTARAPSDSGQSCL